jgi:hypothetical protein
MGVLNDVEIHEFGLGFMSLETDLLTLQMGQYYRQVLPE